MKTTIRDFIGAICLILGVAGSVFSQQAGQLRVGFAANLGEEFFRIKTKDFVARNVRLDSKSSAVALGGGFWVEKFVSRRFSIVPQIDYHFVKANDHIIVDNIAAIPGPVKESFHSLALGLSARYYLPLGSGFRLFGDVGVKVDKMLYFRFQHRNIVSTHSMPDYYGIINPGLTGGLGISKGRWRLSVHYHNYLARSEAKVINPETNSLILKRSVSRQNALIRLSYAFWQAKK